MTEYTNSGQNEKSIGANITTNTTDDLIKILLNVALVFCMDMSTLESWSSETNSADTSKDFSTIRKKASTFSSFQRMVSKLEFLKR